MSQRVFRGGMESQELCPSSAQVTVDADVFEKIDSVLELSEVADVGISLDSLYVDFFNPDNEETDPYTDYDQRWTLQVVRFYRNGGTMIAQPILTSKHTNCEAWAECYPVEKSDRD